MSHSTLSSMSGADAFPASPPAELRAPSLGRDERLAMFAAVVALATAWWGQALALTGGTIVAVALSVPRLLRAGRHPASAVCAWGAAGLAVSVAAIALALSAWLDLDAARAVACAYVVALAIVYTRLRRATRVWRAVPRTRGATLSVGIICYNEADRLPKCLDALRGWPDEIVVLDSGSSDGTADIARRFTDAVFVTDWPGDGPQKQRLLDRCGGDWILVLDADEIATDDFRRDIDAALASPSRFAAYDFPWVHVAFGANVYFGSVGHRFARLFRRGAVRFGDEALHAVPAVVGEGGALDGPVFHHSYRDFAHLLRKHADYAWSVARSRHERGARATAADAILRPVAAFFTAYVVRLGVLDGARGLLMATVHATYTFNKYAALWSLGKHPRP